MRPLSKITAVLAVLSVCTGVVAVRPAGAQIHALETEHLRLIYNELTQSFLAPHVARCFENALRFHRELFDFEPSGKITVILGDLSDFGHGAAVANPRNALLVNIAPPNFVFETYPANERMNTIMNHELVHISALDNAAGSDRFFRWLFRGKVSTTAGHPESVFYAYLTTPRELSPRWYHEGIAVFIETWMAGGIGRAQGAYDEMVFRAMVRDSARFYDPLGLASEGVKIDFQGEVNSYLYGTRFMSYLAHEYSPEQLVQWVSRTPGSKRYYSSQFRRVFGRSLSDVWRDWVEFEHEFQTRNLEAIREYPITPYVDLSQHALGSVSRAYVDHAAGEIYAAVNYPGAVAHVAAISLADGSVRKIKDIKDPSIYSPASLAEDPATRTLFYTTDNNSWRDLCSLDPLTGDSHTLIKDLRLGYLSWSSSEKALYGVRHFNGRSTLARIPAPYDDWHRIHTWPYGETIYDIDVSPDGRLLAASFAEITGRQTLRVFDLEKLALGDTTPLAVREFGGSVPSDFVFSDDGRYLFGSTYYTGASNIFRYDVAADSMEVVSNTETGLFRPVPLGGDSLLVFRYTGEGFVPALIEARPLQDVNAITFLGQETIARRPVLEEWNVGSPADIPIETMTIRDGPYHSVRHIGLENVYPIVEGYKDYPAYGLLFNLSDPISVNRIGLAATYTPNEDLPDDERLHAQLGCRRNRLSLVGKYNDADFYDLFGPTKTSRKGYSVTMQYGGTLLDDSPRTLGYDVSISRYGDLQRLPEFQNVTSSFDKLLAGSAGLSYRNLNFSLGAVDYAKGTLWDITTSGNYVNGKNFPRVRVDAAQGFELPIRHSSIWLRGSAGATPGPREEPFANFFFGGFGNNWVDRGAIQRYRAHYSFPGLELNEVGGINYAKLLLELCLPPLRMRRAGTPGLYGTWVRPSLFSSGLITDLDASDYRRRLANAGVQLDLRMSMLSTLNLTFSVGYAGAFEEGMSPRDEFMFSLKVL